MRLYESGSCAGGVEAQGSAASFASPGLAATVAANATATFTATAADAAGNVSACAAPHAFTEDSTAPQTTITSGPRGKTRKRSASFGFDADEAGSRFECSLDGAKFAPCGSPQRWGRLGRGAHELMVRAIDSSGNGDPTPARRTWKVTRKPGGKRR